MHNDIKHPAIHALLTYAIAAVWLINGLLCKVLGLVPRHGQIVARILGGEWAGVFTMAIGFAEVVMAVWIVSRIKSRLCAVTQMLVVAAMNTLEFILVPDLLLWGRYNSVFALLFVAAVFCHEFVFGRAAARQAQE